MEKVMTQVGEFLNALFNEDDLVEVRMLPSGKRDWRKIKSFTQEFLDELKHANLDGQNIYFGANPRTRKGSSNTDVAMCQCLFVDFDNVSIDYARKIISSGSLPLPTVEVASGHGVHFYCFP